MTEAEKLAKQFAARIAAKAGGKKKVDLLERVSIKQVKTIKTLCQFLQIKLDAWDGFLFTDGSGGSTQQKIGAGYASVLVDAEEVQRHIFNGADNYGTVNSAELSAVVAALKYLVRKEAGVRQHGYRLHVISDSQYVVNGLNKPNMLTWVNNVNHNQLDWFAVYGAIRSGIVIKGYHVPRNQLFFQTICDHVSRNTRVGLYKPPNSVQLSIDKQLQ